jgi:hypothetical protein
MLGTRDDAAPLLGRAKEQDLLTSLLDEVATRGQALVLRGEPGIGKSRLLSEAARTARERGMTCSLCRTFPGDGFGEILSGDVGGERRTGAACRGGVPAA